MRHRRSRLDRGGAGSSASDGLRGRAEPLVSLMIPKFVPSVLHNETNFGTGTLALSAFEFLDNLPSLKFPRAFDGFKIPVIFL
jgi:hypothetical protein